MYGGEISGNSAVGTSGIGGGVSNSGTFRISNGIIYGSNAAVGLRNTATSAAALSGTALIGNFDSSGFIQSGIVSNTDHTIRVISGVLQNIPIREGNLAS
jgi:hypothetical protein